MACDYTKYPRRACRRDSGSCRGKVDIEGNTLEILERTVKRECEEEVGIVIKDAVTFVYSSSFVTEDGRHVINMVFLCEYESGTATNRSPDEVEAVHWLTCDEIMKHPLAPPWTQESIRRVALTPTP